MQSRDHGQGQRLPPLRLGLREPAARVRSSADPEMSPAQLLQALDTPPPAYRLHSPMAILGQGRLVLVSESQRCTQQDTGLDAVRAHGWVELGTARL